MKRIFLTAIIGLICAQQICANDTLNRALQIAGTQFITAKGKFDSNILVQATVPVAAGATLGALATITSAAWYNCHYYRYKAEGNPNSLFINTIINGGATSDPLLNLGHNTKGYRLAYGSTLAGECLGENMCQGIFWSGIIGIIYGLYKHRFTAESGIVSLGTVITGFIFASITGQVLMDTGENEQRTLFMKYEI